MGPTRVPGFGLEQIVLMISAFVFASTSAVIALLLSALHERRDSFARRRQDRSPSISATQWSGTTGHESNRSPEKPFGIANESDSIGLSRFLRGTTRSVESSMDRTPSSRGSR